MKRLLKIILWTFLIFFILINFISATNAYKFTHFYDPGEVVIKTGNEKNLWDHTKEIFFGMNFIKKQNDPIPDSFSTVILTTGDNLKLDGWYRKANNPKGSVALFHGHGGNKSGVLSEANAFLNMGYNVLLLDFRAHGNSGGNTCTVGYREAEDVKLAFDYLKNKGEKNIVLWGISMGAAAISHAIAEYNLQPSKVILEMPFGTIEDAVEARIRIMHLPEEPLATLLTFWGGTEHGFWAFGMKPEEYVKQIHCPVLMQAGQNDTRVTQSEREDVFRNLNQPKRLVIYKNSGHESLCKKEYLKWLSSVSTFLNG
jgi:alpha-beta hydrolase superfamily lysophospholipase